MKNLKNKKTNSNKLNNNENKRTRESRFKTIGLRGLKVLGIGILTIGAATIISCADGGPEGKGDVTEDTNVEQPSDIEDGFDAGVIDVGPMEDLGPGEETVNCAEMNSERDLYYEFTTPEAEEVEVKSGEVVSINGESYVPTNYVDGKVILSESDAGGNLIDNGTTLEFDAKERADNPNYHTRVVITINTTEKREVLNEGETLTANGGNTTITYQKVNADGEAVLEIYHADGDGGVIFQGPVEIVEGTEKILAPSLTIKQDAIGQDVAGNECYILKAEFTVESPTGSSYDTIVPEGDSWNVLEGRSIRVERVVSASVDHAEVTVTDGDNESLMIVAKDGFITFNVEGKEYKVHFKDAIVEDISDEVPVEEPEAPQEDADAGSTDTGLTDVEEDTGSHDTGTTDTSSPDTEMEEDTGDAGSSETETDTGSSDTGSSDTTTDTSSPDAGPSDSGETDSE